MYSPPSTLCQLDRPISSNYISVWIYQRLEGILDTIAESCYVKVRGAAAFSDSKVVSCKTTHPSRFPPCTGNQCRGIPGPQYPPPITYQSPLLDPGNYREPEGYPGQSPLSPSGRSSPIYYSLPPSTPIYYYSSEMGALLSPSGRSSPIYYYSSEMGDVRGG